jgi:hypothetical protein
MKTGKSIISLTLAVMILAGFALPASASEATVTAAPYVYYSKTEILSEEGTLLAGCTRAESNYTAGSNITSEAGSTDPVNPEGTAFKISYSNTDRGFDFVVIPYNLTYATKDMTYVCFDIYKDASVTNNILLRFYKNASGVGDYYNTISIEPYLSETSQWQTVRIPVSAFPDTATFYPAGGGQTTVDYNWNYDVTALQFAFSLATTADIYLKNMYISTEGQEMYDYYYDHPGIIYLVKDGERPPGINVSTVNSGATPSEPDVVADGLKSIKQTFENTGVSMQFGNNDSNPFAAVTSSHDYCLLIKIKFEEAHNSSLRFTRSNGNYNAWGTSNNGTIGSYLKATTSWQTAIIPLTEFSERDYTKLKGLGLTLGSTGGINQYYPTIYLNELALVPITAIKYNGVPYEKTLKDSYLIFRNGAMKNGKDAGKFPSNLDNTPSISFQDPSSTKPGQYSLKVMQVNTNGAGKGPAFDISDCGITDENYKTKYFKFDVINSNSNVFTMTIYRSKTTSKTDGEYDTCRVSYKAENMVATTVILPLEKLTQNSGLSWSDINYIAPTFDDGNWYKVYFIDNVSIGDYVDGKAAAVNASVIVEGNEAFARLSVSNTMTAAYDYVPEEKDIIVVKEYDVIKSINVLETEGDVIMPDATITLDTPKVPIPTPDFMSLIYLYRWNNLNDIKPLGEVVIQPYYNFDD